VNEFYYLVKYSINILTEQHFLNKKNARGLKTFITLSIIIIHDILTSDSSSVLINTF